MRTFRLRTLASVLCIVAYAAMTAGTAAAAETTVTDNISLAGETAEQHVAHLEAFCDDCAPDDLFSCGGCEVAGGGRADVFTKVSWNAPATVSTKFDPADLHQGAAAPIQSTIEPGAGTISISYRIPFQVGLFGRNGDFPPGPEWHLTQEYKLTGSPTLTTGAPCTPGVGGTFTCSKVDTINVVPETCFFFGCPVDVTVDLLISHDFTVDNGEIVAHRVTTAQPGQSVSFSGAPATHAESLAVPCDAAVGSDVTYQLQNIQYTAGPISVDAGATLRIFVDGPFSANATFNIPIVSGVPVHTGTIAMNAGDADQITLGNVMPDNIAPVVGSIIQGGTFVEGSPVSFTGLASDNCGGLVQQWSFSDGGVAFGETGHHTFDDNGNYSGLLRVTDAAGNLGQIAFDVEPIANAAPGVTAPTGAAADWGVPIEFHVDAIDPGSADQPTLQFAWDFGDGANALGQDVSHAWANPGVYGTMVTVSDKDGGVANAVIPTTISDRVTTLVYNGPTQSLPSKWVTLSAQLIDELGAPVVGRGVTFTLGDQVGSGITDGTGTATTTFKLKQKPGLYPVSAEFFGDPHYISDTSDPTVFQIGK